MSNTNLPSIKRYFSEDYKGAPSWFTSQFLSALNLFTEPIFNILNGGVSVSQNTLEEIYIYTISIASATGSSNTFTFTPKKFVGPPSGVLLAQCLLSAPVLTAVGNPVTIDWAWTGSQIKILAVYGLTSSSSYTISLRIF